MSSAAIAQLDEAPMIAAPRSPGRVTAVFKPLNFKQTVAF